VLQGNSITTKLIDSHIIMLSWPIWPSPVKGSMI